MPKTNEDKLLEVLQQLKTIEREFAKEGRIIDAFSFASARSVDLVLRILSSMDDLGESLRDDLEYSMEEEKRLFRKYNNRVVMVIFGKQSLYGYLKCESDDEVYVEIDGDHLKWHMRINVAGYEEMYEVPYEEILKIVVPNPLGITFQEEEK